MPTTSHDWDDQLPFTAPAGGFTAGTLFVFTGNKAAVLPMQTKTSGQIASCKARGLVKGVVAVSTAAFSAGDPLTISSGLVAAAVSAAGTINAWAAADKVSTAVVCDVILTPPIPVV